MSNKLCRLLTLDIQHANALSRHQLPVTTKKTQYVRKKNKKKECPDSSLWYENLFLMAHNYGMTKLVNLKIVNHLGN